MSRSIACLAALLSTMAWGQAVQTVPGGYLDAAGDFSVAHDFTIECWFQFDSIQNPARDNVNMIVQTPQMELQLEFVTGRPDSVHAGSFDGSVGRSWSSKVVGTTIFQPKTWHHLAYVMYYDSSAARNVRTLYVDGQVDGADKLGSSMPAPPGDLIIGKETDPQITDRQFWGVVDEVRLWSRSRSEAQVRATKDTELGQEYLTDSGLVAYFRFDDAGSGAPINLVHPGNPPASLVGGATLVASGAPIAHVPLPQAGIGSARSVSKSTPRAAFSCKPVGNGDFLIVYSGPSFGRSSVSFYNSAGSRIAVSRPAAGGRSGHWTVSGLRGACIGVLSVDGVQTSARILPMTR